MLSPRSPFVVVLLRTISPHLPLLRRSQHTINMGQKASRLEGKHVFITGASKGIGLALAKELVRRGCDLTIVARSKADLQQALAQLQQAAEAHGRSPKLQALPADIQDPAEVRSAAAGRKRAVP